MYRVVGGIQDFLQATASQNFAQRLWARLGREHFPASMEETVPPSTSIYFLPRCRLRHRRLNKRSLLCALVIPLRCALPSLQVVDSRRLNRSSGSCGPSASWRRVWTVREKVEGEVRVGSLGIEGRKGVIDIGETAVMQVGKAPPG